MEIVIRPYTEADEVSLFDLMVREGEEWQAYWSDTGRIDYLKAIHHATLLMVAVEGEQVIGFVRCIGIFTIYVDDLLVDKVYRGKGLGRRLLNAVMEAFPQMEVYVLSDEDGYYEKLGYEKVGSVFSVKP